jgi:sRNA-binding protein
MAHLKMEGLEAGILPVLVKCFPRAFFPSGRVCRPLRIGIFEDLNAVLPLEIDRAELKACLGLYTGQPGYLRELKPGAIRIGLNGRATGRVSPREPRVPQPACKSFTALKMHCLLRSQARHV